MNKDGTHIVDAFDKLDAQMLRMIRSWLIMYMRKQEGKPVQRMTLEQEFQKYLRTVTDTFEDIVDCPKDYHFVRLVKEDKDGFRREYILDNDIKRTIIKVKNQNELRCDVSPTPWADSGRDAVSHG